MLNTNQKEMIDKLITAIQAEATFVKQNNELPIEEQVQRMDVLLDTFHFLKDYEQNVQILNKYNSDHRFDHEK